MKKITYKVVKQDGGWVYEVNGTYSEKFPTRALARKASKSAAGEVAGESAGVTDEHEKTRWHAEVADGGHRPETVVES